MAAEQLQPEDMDERSAMLPADRHDHDGSGTLAVEIEARLADLDVRKLLPNPLEEGKGGGPD